MFSSFTSFPLWLRASLVVRNNVERLHRTVENERIRKKYLKVDLMNLLETKEM